MSFFNQKAVYITGGNSGIGLEAAKQLAAHGAHILVFNRTAPDSFLWQIEEARRSPNQRVAHYQLDVADRDSVQVTIARAVHEFGPPDIFINMAGIGGLAEFAEMKFEMFDRLIKINLYGSRNVVEAVLPFMLSRGRGQIVLVSSMGGIVPVYGYTAYGTSKFALVGFAQCLRYELKPRGIDVSCFCPGEVDTPALAAERAATHPAAVAIKKIGGTISAEHAAQGLLKGMQGRTFMIVPGVKSRITYWAYRLTPLWLWNTVTDGIISNALNGMKRPVRNKV